MDQHLGHAERVGNKAGVLAAGTTEAVQRIARHVVAALHRDLLDRVGHVLDGDLDEAVGDLFRRFSADLFRQFGKGRFHGVCVERLVLLGPEDFWEELRDQLAGHHIRIGDGEGATAAITCRARIGAGTVGADAEARAVEVQDRSAACRDRVNEHHRCAHAHARDFCLECALVFAVVVRYVGGGAAHVEADQVFDTGFVSGLGHADHAARGTGEDRVLALEQLCRGEAARRHHEHQPSAGRLRIQLGAHCRHVAPQDRRKISVHHGGVATPDQLDERRDLVADRHLRKAHLARELRHALLVLGIAIGVHEYDRDSLDAIVECLRQRVADIHEIGLQLNGTVGARALGDLDDALEQHLGLDDVFRKNLRTRLVADAKRVAETLGRDEERAVALALEQRIGRNCGAHLHGTDMARRNRFALLQPKQIADALHRGVAVGLRILGKQFVGNERAIGLAADDVGEGAATIDPEIPGLSGRALAALLARLLGRVLAFRPFHRLPDHCQPRPRCHSLRRKSGVK